MVSGGLENGRELFVCRAAYANKVFPGKTWDGLSGCFVSVETEPLATSYQVLPKYYFVYRWATRTEMITNPSLWNLAVQGGFDSGNGADSDYHVCSRDLSVNGASVSIRDANSEGHLVITAR